MYINTTTVVVYSFWSDQGHFFEREDDTEVTQQFMSN